MTERGFQAAMKEIANIGDEDVDVIKKFINCPEKNCKRMSLEALKERFELSKKRGVTSERMQALIDKDMSLLEKLETISKKIDKTDKIIEDVHVSRIANMDADMDRYGRYMTMADKRKDRQLRLKLNKEVRVMHKDSAKSKETSKKQMRDLRHMIKVTTGMKRLFDVLEKL